MAASLALEQYQSLFDCKTEGCRSISVLGSTGTIGVNTLDLISRNSEQYDVIALCANRNAELLAEQAIAHRARIAVIADQSKYSELKERLSGTDIKAAAGEDAVIEAAASGADWTMAAIVGAAGLRPTLAAVQQGKTVALANKECLVSAGELFTREVKKANTVLLPVDSEHSALFQSLAGHPYKSVEKLVITASGGPFREWSAEDIRNARPDQALKHPNWSMGQKITIDSASMMNKGLELIETWHLFPFSVEQLDVVVHPQSIIHGYVMYEDGSVITQMGSPDMRTPIAFSLAWPLRMNAPVKPLDLVELGSLTFEKPDPVRFPALRLAREVLEDECRMGAVLNAANEVAVEAFLSGKLSFGSMMDLVEEVLSKYAGVVGCNFKDFGIDDVIDLDEKTRKTAYSLQEAFEIS